MQYREDKRSGSKISALGFGCMRLPKESLSEQLILKAIDEGINYFDTAFSYAGNEAMLGRIITRNSLRDKMLIASKLPHNKAKTIEDAASLLSTSLERLQTDHIDYYLIHNLATYDQWERLVEMGAHAWLDAERAAGRIGQIGFSFHGTLPEFEKIMESYDWDFIQLQYNYVNVHYQAGAEGVAAAEERGIPVMIMEPLLGGKLVNSLPKGSREVFAKSERGYSPAAWGLRWLWDQPGVTCVLSGMNAFEQLDDNLAIACDAEPGCMTESDHATLDAAKAAFEESFKVPCTGCNYCMPCPKGISIPSTFTAYNESYALSWFTGLFHYMMSAGIASKTPHFPSDCIGCGKCVKACPQHLDIPALLKSAQHRLQPPIVKPASKVISKFF